MIRWFTRYGPEGASSRYRCYQYLPLLAKAGFDCKVEPLAPWNGPWPSLAKGVVRRTRSLSQLSDHGDVLVIQKEPIMPPALWPRVRRSLSHCGPVIWDLDDAVWIGASGAQRMASNMASLATVIVAGNELIADWCRRHGASRVWTIPTCFDPLTTPVVPPDSGVVEIVWVGSPATTERFRAELRRLRGILSSPVVHLTCVGAPAFEIAAANPPRFLPWSPAAEHEALSRAHYGLSLLPRDEYSDHKCGFKLVQYMAYGVTPIATRSPVHESILGSVGYLVGEQEDADSLSSILRSTPSASDRQAAIDRWALEFSVEAGARSWANILSALNPGSSPE